jgi:glycosyltransferase involved in cell wall biosynthesis
MPAVYNALDIGVSSSYGEGFSNTIVEGMSCGVPHVVTDVGDSALIVNNIGVVVPPSSPEAMCNGFHSLLTQLSPELRLRVRASIVSRYSNKKLIEKTLDVLANNV